MARRSRLPVTLAFPAPTDVPNETKEAHAQQAQCCRLRDNPPEIVVEQVLGGAVTYAVLPHVDLRELSAGLDQAD